MIAATFVFKLECQYTIQHVFASLLLPSSDHVIINLEGYKRKICHEQVIAWEYVGTEQL